MAFRTAICLAMGWLAATGSLRADEPRGVTQTGGRPIGDELRSMIESARDGVYPALVNISVVTMRYASGKEFKGRATGSGTIISKDGTVLTNQHVTFNGKKFRCTLADKQEVAGTLVGEDPLTDLAVIRLNLQELRDPGALPVAHFGDSDTLRVGDYVMAMGSPLSLSRSVTLGIVSNTERVFTGQLGLDDQMTLEEGQRTGLFTRWIQHDALINPGNSGGPLVNMHGEVVGVNELGGNAIGFAIPGNLARQVADALVAHGEVPRSWIGVSLRPIQKTGLQRGVLLNSVVEHGPAERAGLRAGDLLVKIDGEAVTVRFPEEVPPLMRVVADHAVGSELKISYERDGKPGEAILKTEKLQKDRGEEGAFRGWGLTALEITEFLARQSKLADAHGVMVSSVRSGGPAQLAEPALDEDDVIRTVEGEPVANFADFVARYQKIMSVKPLPEYVAIGFERRGRNYVTLIKPAPEKEDDPPREVPKAWIGVETQPLLKNLAKRLDPEARVGFRVTRVYPKTEADRAGLKVGDIVLSLNGDRLSPRGMQDSGMLDRRVRKLSESGTAKLKVLRGADVRELAVKLERTRLTPQEALRDRNRDFELNVRELTFFDRDENQWDDAVRGVLVEGVEPAGWAGLGGVRSGDLIQRIGDAPITDLESYRAVMRKVGEAQPERVVFVVLRDVETRYLFVEPDWKPVSSAAASSTTQAQEK
ncbi:MAG: PDZ domain-containing protein [Phycisphaerae bacterium]